MKKIFFLFIYIFIINIAFGQQELEKINLGLEAFRNGDYDAAIEYYEEALTINPDSYDAVYELAITHLQKQNFEKAIEYSNKILEADNNLHIHAYITKASAYDYMGKTEDAVEILSKAIKEEGDDYLLHYNLGYYYFSMLENEKASFHIQEAIRDNNNHASSHLLLASIEVNNENRVKSLFPFYYYLLLEPTSVRSKDAFDALTHQIYNENESEEISVDDEYYLIKSYLNKRDSSDNSINKSEFDVNEFIELSSALFAITDNVEIGDSNIYSEFYQPFFSSLSNSKHVFTFGNYITQIVSESSYRWSLDNKAKLDEFIEWMKENHEVWEFR